MQAELTRRKWDEKVLAARRKGDAGKLAIARRLRRETTVTLAWITKEVYTNGESVTAILLIRNATNQFCHYYDYPRYSGVCDGPASFYVTSDSGAVLPGHYLHIPQTDPKFINVPELGYQHKLLEHLNDGYDLTNGGYNLQAEVGVAFPGMTNWEYLKVKSATVKIKIEDPSASPKN